MPPTARNAALALIAAACAVLGACELPGKLASPAAFRPADTEPSLELKPTSYTIYTGETVTILAITRNTLGHDAKLEWEAQFGKLVKEDNGRKARLTADKPGRITVKAYLHLGQQVITSMVSIEVKPLP